MKVRLHRVLVLVATTDGPQKVEQAIDRGLASKFYPTGEATVDARWLGETEVEIPDPPSHMDPEFADRPGREYQAARDKWHDQHWPEPCDYDDQGEKVR